MDLVLQRRNMTEIMLSGMKKTQSLKRLQVSESNSESVHVIIITQLNARIVNERFSLVAYYLVASKFWRGIFLCKYLKIALELLQNVYLTSRYLKHMYGSYKEPAKNKPELSPFFM